MKCSWDSTLVLTFDFHNVLMAVTAILFTLHSAAAPGKPTFFKDKFVGHAY